MLGLVGQKIFSPIERYGIRLFSPIERHAIRRFSSCSGRKIPPYNPHPIFPLALGIVIGELLQRRYGR